MGHSLGEYSALVAAGAIDYAAGAAPGRRARRGDARRGPGAARDDGGAARAERRRRRGAVRGGRRGLARQLQLPGPGRRLGEHRGHRAAARHHRRARRQGGAPAGGRGVSLPAHGARGRAARTGARRLEPGRARRRRSCRPPPSRSSPPSGCARCCWRSSSPRCGSATPSSTRCRWASPGSSSSAPGRVLSGLVRRVRRDAETVQIGIARRHRGPGGGRLMASALVTGASRGIGAACAVALARPATTCAIGYVRDADGAARDRRRRRGRRPPGVDPPGGRRRRGLGRPRSWRRPRRRLGRPRRRHPQRRHHPRRAGACG